MVARTLAYLQTMVDIVESDDDAQRAVSTLVLEATKNRDLDSLIATLCSNPHIRMGTVRVALQLALEHPASTARSVHHYLLLLRSLLGNEHHVEHLNVREWADFWAVLRSTLPHAESLHDSQSGLQCLTILLSARSSIDPGRLSDICDFLTEHFPAKSRESSLDRLVFACIRQLVCLTMHDDHSVAYRAVEHAVAYWNLLDRTRDVALKQEFALIANLLDSSFAELITAPVVTNLEQFLAPDTHIDLHDIEFTSATNTNWVVKTDFRPRSLAKLYPFLVLNGIANIRTLISPSTTKRARTSNSDLAIAIACFSQETTLSLPELILENPSTFWTYILLGSHSTQLDYNQAFRLAQHCRNALGKEVYSSAAAFCLARCLRHLVTLPTESPSDVTNLIVSLLSSLEHFSALSSGMVSLFETLRTLRILDLEINRLVQTRLNQWLLSQIERSITSIHSDFPFESFCRLLGLSVPSRYQSDANRFLLETPLPECPQSTITRLLSDTDFNSKLFQTRPARQHFWPFLLLSIISKGNKLPDFPPGIIKTDTAGLYVFSQALKASSITLPAKLSKEFEEFFNTSEWMKNEDSSILREAKYLLTSDGSFPHLDDFPYVPITYPADTQFFKTAMSKLFSSYETERSTLVIVRMCEYLYKFENRDRAWNQAFRYFYDFISRQSWFSPTRVPLAKICDNLIDFVNLLKDSSAEGCMTALQNYQIPDTLDYDSIELLKVINFRDEPVQERMLLSILRNGADIAYVLYQMLRLDRCAEAVLHLCDSTDLTPFELLRKAESRLFPLWSLSSDLSTFPWPIFESSPQQHIDSIPLLGLSETWISDPCFFSSFYALGLQDESVMNDLKSRYSLRSFEQRTKKVYHRICYHVWISTHIGNSHLWEDFPTPVFRAPCLQEVPPYAAIDDSLADWIIEKLLVEALSSDSPVYQYTVLRQCWQVLESLESPIESSPTLAKGAVALSRRSNSLYAPASCIILHLLENFHQPFCLELACASNDTEIRSKLCEKIGRKDVVSVALLEVESDNMISDQTWVQVFEALEKWDSPYYGMEFFLQKLNSASVWPDFKDSDTISRLIKWTSVFHLDGNRDWRVWIARLASKLPSQIDCDARSTSSASMLYESIQRHGYEFFLAVSGYLRVLSPNDAVGPFKNRKNYSGALYQRPVTEVYSENGFARDLFGEFSSNLLDYAFCLDTSLAARLVPNLIADIATQPSRSKEIAKVLDLGISSGNSSIKGLVLNIISQAYQNESLLLPYAVIVDICVELGRGSLGLMMLELSWSSQDTILDNNLFHTVTQLIADPDIPYTTDLAPSLDTVSLNLDSWGRLGYNITKFENTPKRSSLSEDLKQTAFYRLAETIQKTGYYDYNTAWKLGDWDLPGTDEPSTKPEILFNLFRSMPPNFEQAYFDAWNISLECVGMISRIEKMAPGFALDEDERLARERFLNSLGSNDHLLLEYSVNVDKLIKHGDNEAALKTALKIETLQKSGNLDTHGNILCNFQCAQVAWALGDRNSSVKMLEIVCREELFLQKQSYYDPSHILCTLATWSAETKQVSDQVIFNTYLKPAETLASSSENPLVRARTFHQFAKFCDSKFRDPLLESNIEQARAMREGQRAKVLSMQENIRRSTESSHDVLRSEHNRIRKATQLYEAEQREYRHLKETRQAYLASSVEFYLRSLEFGTDITNSVIHDTSRFISLWFSNHDNAGVNKVVDVRVSKVPSSVFVTWINQLSSRLDMSETPFQILLRELVIRMAIDHPIHTLWPILSLTIGETAGSSAVTERVRAGTYIWEKSEGRFSKHIKEFSSMLISLANVKVKAEEKHRFGLNKLKPQSQAKWWKSIGKLQIPSPTVSVPLQQDRNYARIPYITLIDEHIAIASGLSAPKVLKFHLSNGETHTMLVKGGNDDPRQDAIMEQVFGNINYFFRNDRPSRMRNLAARTYNVVPLGPKVGVIEFVQNTKSFMSVVNPLHQEYDDRDWNHIRARTTMHEAHSKGKDARIAAFDEVRMHIHPVFRYFFFNSFKNSQQWLERRTTYTRSTAAMSLLGYVLGLGDRHCNNILLDVETGEVVHIDLGIAFDQGKLLRIPETVPFRLTRDLVDGMGVGGVKGVFTRCAQVTLDLLRMHETGILTILDVLRYDPLYNWTISLVKNRNKQTSSDISFVSDRLKYAGNDAGPASAPLRNADADQALIGVKRKLSNKLSTEATVRELIQEATSPTNLALIFEGWCPFY